MSSVLEMYANLVAQDVSIGGKVVTAYNLESLPPSINTAKLPCRLLLPVGDMSTEGRDATFIAIGNTITVDWQIKDLMLYRPLGQGIGLHTFAGELVEYAGAYMDMAREFRAPSIFSSLESANALPGIYEYPAGSGNLYAGVLCTLLIHEVING